MHVLLFILYGAIACYILPRLKFFRNSGIRPGFLLAIFSLRVLTGCLHNWIAWRYYPHHGDIWTFFQASFTTRAELRAGFGVFWAHIYRVVDIPHNFIEWIHLVFNCLSLDNIYINTLFFNFFTFSGYIALFNVFYLRSGENTLSALPALLLPSVLFWTSCIHTEGLVYPLLGWLFYTMHQGLTRGWPLRRFINCLLLTGLVIFFRPALAPGLIPGLLIWRLAESSIPRKKLLIILSFTGLAIVILLCCFPALLSLIPKTLSARQLEFQVLNGNSRLPLPLLTPDWSSLLKTLPWALLNGFFQPLPGSGGQPIYLAFSLELMAIWMIILFCLVKRKTGGSPTPSNTGPAATFSGATAFTWCCLLFSLLGMCLVGYIIPFAGAIVRYRSLYLPFLLAPFIGRLQSYSQTLSLNRRIKNYIFK